MSAKRAHSPSAAACATSSPNRASLRSFSPRLTRSSGARARGRTRRRQTPRSSIRTTLQLVNQKLTRKGAESRRNGAPSLRAHRHRPPLLTRTRSACGAPAGVYVGARCHARQARGPRALERRRGTRGGRVDERRRPQPAHGGHPGDARCGRLVADAGAADAGSQARRERCRGCPPLRRHAHARGLRISACRSPRRPGCMDG